MSKEIDKLIEQYKGMRGPDETDYLLIDLYQGEKSIGEGMPLDEFRKVVRREFRSFWEPLILVCRNPSKTVERWIEFYPSEAVTRAGYSTKVTFLKDEYARAMVEHLQAKADLLGRLKIEVFQEEGVTSHKNVQKCWDLACSQARAGDLEGVVSRFREFSLLLT